jgi:ankyrin repeat protein
VTLPATALLDAATQGDVARVQQALAAGTEVDARDHLGRTPLLLAAAADHVDVARTLVEHGADPNVMDDRHDTPWLVTGVTGSVAMGEVLLAAGADLTIRNRYGGVSVIPASERGHLAYVRWVSHTGIDVNHVNDIGWTALLEAVILGDGSPTYEQIVTALLAAGADPHLADRDGVTPLTHARAKGHARLATVLEEASR